MKLTPPLGLAPLAGITHRAFRRLVAELGGVSLFYTEMLNSRIISTQNPWKDPYCLDACLDQPLVAQIVGGEPEVIGRAIERLSPMGFDAFDINMGCPQKAIMKHGWGASLLGKPDVAKRIVARAKQATMRPIFVKLRSLPGHDLDGLVAFVKGLVDEGVDLIVLHPRSVEDGFKRPAKWEEIRALREEIDVPIYGNGDVFGPDDALKMIRHTRANGVLIGRGAVVRPWLFWEIVHGRKWPGDPLCVLKRFLSLLTLYSPPPYRRRQFLLFLGWFLRNWEHHHHLFKVAKGVDDPFEATHLIEKEIRMHGLNPVNTPIYFKI